MFTPMITSALLILLAQTQAPDFTGLWGATLRLGPEVRGTLILERTAEGWFADLAGFRVPVKADGLTFELPGNRGAFRNGHWLQPEGFATPVRLIPDGPNRRHGTVTPLEQSYTFYMPITKKADGTYATYLRNPERNQGRFIRAQRIEFNGEDVKLLGTGGRPDGTLSIGRYYDDGVIRLPLRWGTYDFQRVTDTATSPFYPRGKPAPKYQYTKPLQLDDGWPVGTLEQAGISRDSIERFVQYLLDMPMDSLGTLQIHSLLIARHGRLVLEEYFHGYTRDTPHDTRSASKSWTNVLIGAAMQAGVPLRINSPVYETMGVQTDDPRKRAMTLEHLITMTAGFNCDPDDTTSADEDVMDNRGIQGWYRYTLNVPLISAPGDKIFYCSTEPNLASGMLAKVAGRPLIQLFHELVAEPLQLSNYYLFLRDGDRYGGGGDRNTPRDFAKMAQLMLNNGRWGGKQILSAEWVRQSGAPLRDLGTTQQYGYLWNSQEFDYKGRKVRAVFAGGNGGQVSLEIPDLDLVIAFTGGNYGTRGLNPQRLLQAVN
ncbi:MAG TPA: serine hydrolase [Gemmatimonadales bacterium]|nr:serine hydrolase [Gemmatimonadales bacterium]